MELPNLHYEGDDLFTAPGSYFHFTEPFPELFPGLSGLHCAYDIPPVTISDCIMTVGLHMTRERRGLWKSDERNAVRSHPHLLEKVCFMDRIGITTRSVFASQDAVVTQVEIHNGERREITFQSRLMGGWTQTGRAEFARNRLTLHHLFPPEKTWRTVILAPSFRVGKATVGVPRLNVHSEWPQLEGTRFGPANMYELVGPEVRLRPGGTHRFEVVMGLSLGRVKVPAARRGVAYAPAARRAERAWQASTQKAVLTSSDPALAGRYAYAKQVLRSNLVATHENIHGPISLANKKTCGLWFWDTCFHGMGWASLDRVTAERHILALVERQLPNGLIPQVISNRRTISGLPQPPVLPFMAFEVYRLYRNDRFMRALMPAMEKLIAWWDRHRFSEAWSLYYYQDAFDSGWDNSVRYDRGAGWVAPDLNGMMYRNLEILAGLHRRWGNTGKADAYAARCRRLGEAIQMRLWNAKVNFFCDGDLPRVGRLFDVKSPAGFLPLVVPQVTEAQKKAVVRHLFNPREFWLPHPIPTVSADNPNFVPWEYSYPRGTTWVAFGNWLTHHALRRAGLDGAAHALALRTIRTLADCPQASIYEHYNSVTGDGHGYAMFGWSSATLVDLVRREFGVDVTDDGNWVFTAPLVDQRYRFEMQARGHRVVCAHDGRHMQVTLDGRRCVRLARGTRCAMGRDGRQKAEITLAGAHEDNH